MTEEKRTYYCTQEKRVLASGEKKRKKQFVDTRGGKKEGVRKGNEEGPGIDSKEGEELG